MLNLFKLAGSSGTDDAAASTIPTRDQRTYWQRALIALPPVFLALFMYILFAPVEMYTFNQTLPFTASDVFVPLLLLLLCSTVIAVGLLALVRGAVFNVLIALVFAFALASYLQGNILNIDLGTLDGVVPNWTIYRRHTVFNLLIWAAVVALVFAGAYFLRKLWPRILKWGSLLLVTMQVVALVSMVLSPGFFPEAQGYRLSAKDEFVLSEDKNVVVFVLDTFSAQYMDSVLTEYPEVGDVFSDFTLFRNYATRHFATFPAMTEFATAHPYDPSVPYREEITNAWADEKTQTFYGTLDAAGFQIHLFTNPAYISNDGLELQGLIDNAIPDKPQIITANLLRYSTILSIYRFAPHAIKPSFLLYTDDLHQIVLQEDRHHNRNEAFYADLSQNGLSVQSNSNVYVLYHLYGAHLPYYTDRYAQPGESTTREEATRGALFIVETYMAMMKEAGIYDNAAIIVTADHGHQETPSALMMVKRPGVSGDGLVLSYAPVSQVDYLPTVLQLAGIDHAAFGKTLFEYSENEPRERLTMKIGPGELEYPSDWWWGMRLYRYTKYVDEVTEADANEALEMADSFYSRG